MPDTRSRSRSSRLRRPSLGSVNRIVLGSNRSAGIDDGIGQGMEMALTIVVFFGLGWLIDSWADTRPIFTIALAVFAMVGQSVRMWLAYDARMRVLEKERRQRASGSTESEKR